VGHALGSRLTLRTLIILFAVAVSSISAFGQIQAVPAFTVSTNDVVQSSITVFHMDGTNGNRVTVKFAFTETGAKRLEEFYHSHTVGQPVRFRIGTFERTFKLDDRKHFGRDGFWGLPESESTALEAGLRGRR
jgi:hypothetical protein